MYICILRELGT